MKLTEADYRMLAASGISRETADQAGLYRVISIEGRELVGRKGGGDFSGMVFPYRLPGTRLSVLDRLRLDHPPVDMATGKPEHKYLTAPASRNRLYFPPCDPKLLTDPGVPLVVTEGEKKCLALWDLARASGSQFLPVAVAGVWSWRGTVGAMNGARGERCAVKGVIPDFHLLEWKQRKLTIVFDVNAATNSMVGAARRYLAANRTFEGAEVWLGDVPALEGVNGIDDLAGLYGQERAQVVIGKARRYEWDEELIRNEKDKILPRLANVITCLRMAPEWHGVLRYDEFSLTISAARNTPWGPVEKWSDTDTARLLEWLQRRGLGVGMSDVYAAVDLVAKETGYHPVREYLEELVWDWKPRIDSWLGWYLGAKQNPLTEAIGAKWLISAVARVYEPGCQADHVLILEGRQGLGKSTAIGILGKPFYTDDIADFGSKDAALATAGVWLIELAELDSLTHAEVSRIKSFVSRKVDRYRPPYGRYLAEMPRQCVFGGTVNHPQYLKDETGGRRFWPVECGEINLAALAQDRDQIWAEAVHRYKNRERWWLDHRMLIEAAEREQDARYIADPWEEPIAKWAVRPSRMTFGDEGAAVVPVEITTATVLEFAIGKDKGHWTRADENRVGEVLRRLDYRPKRRWEGGKAGQRVYEKTLATAASN